MSDLRKLAEAAEADYGTDDAIITARGATGDYIAATCPDVILALLDERDAFRDALEAALHHLTRTPVPGWSVDLTNIVRDALDGR